MTKLIPHETVETAIREVEDPCVYEWKLSPSESKVCYWLLEGKSLPEVAVILGKGIATVKQQTLSIYRKLGGASRPQLFAKYVSDCRQQGMADRTGKK